MAKRDKKKKGWGPGRSNFSLTQFAVVALAGWLIWHKTDSWVVTVLIGAIVLLLVSADMVREIVRLLIAIERGLERCYIAFMRARVEMFREQQRTLRDRIRYSSRIELERARQDSFAMRLATKSHKQLANSATAEEADPLSEILDAKFRVISR